MTPQQDVAGMLAWFLIIATAMVWAGYWIAKMIRVTRLDDAYPPDTCQVGKCKQVATNVYGRHPSGQVLLICDLHALRVQRPKFEVVYDQELASGTDFDLWNREISS